MDNRIFNVNGSGDDLLLKALELVFMQEKCNGAKAWSESKEHGLVLHWYHSGSAENRLPGAMTANECLSFVNRWLESEFANTVNLSSFCDEHENATIEKGWQVYVEDWGHVGNHRNAICAIKPAFMWFGQ